MGANEQVRFGGGTFFGVHHVITCPRETAGRASRSPGLRGIFRALPCTRRIIACFLVSAFNPRSY